MLNETAEVIQMHDIDKIVGRRSAETEEGLGTPEGDEPVAKKTAEAHLAQHIDRVVDVPMDKEPGDAEDSVWIMLHEVLQ